MVVWNVHISVLWNVLSLFVYFNCQPVPPSIHPSLHLVDFILLEIFCFCFLLYAACIAHACDRCVIRVPTNGVQQLVHSAPQMPQSKKRWSYVAITIKTKCKSTTPREFAGYSTGGSFKRKTFLVTALDYMVDWKKERRWTIPIYGRFRLTVCPFKMVTVYVAISTVDWGMPLTLLRVLLDASTCSPAMIISPWKR